MATGDDTAAGLFRQVRWIDGILDLQVGVLESRVCETESKLETGLNVILIKSPVVDETPSVKLSCGKYRSQPLAVLGARRDP